ncbi:phosphomethylpyrimidine synthase ThiC [Aminiphilus circumscriptus]|uniref:phosphomethylpyrimidine synthase ThiC n=1 Tax=Aminiphilus circumscriptus TaxID=290732 RepID=UPI0004B44169|nr:phosphomethylpyrimidine synthase ThiC [Aminiphilus circumscriptus]
MEKSGMTLMERARRGDGEGALKEAAERESLSPEVLLAGVAAGTAVVPANPAHRGLVPCGIGQGLRTKVNANIGTSEGHAAVDLERRKLVAAVESGADAVMDLSTGGDLPALRAELLRLSPLPLGTVPLYEAAQVARSRHDAVVRMTVEDLFEVIERQAAEGVDFMTVHTGLTRRALSHLMEQGRVADVVSRGGSILVAWMLQHDRENPLAEHFDRLLSIARTHEVTLSLGDGLRPGAGADATDRAQVAELLELGAQVRRCREAGVQVMVEGPGHVPLGQIGTNVQLQKRLCEGAPFYVLGPLVTDVAPGYDHIVGAIGGAVAAAAGADFLCYVTPSEHLDFPDVEDVRAGVTASRIAAHVGDVEKGLAGAAEWDLEMSRARKALDWERQERAALDPSAVRARRAFLKDGEGCAMCGPLCAMKIVSRALAAHAASGSEG